MLILLSSCAVNLFADINDLPRIVTYLAQDTNLNNSISEYNSLLNELEARFMGDFKVVDQSEITLYFKNKIYEYQETGRVSDAQLIEMGEEMQAKYVCYVFVRKGASNDYVYDVRVLDIKESTLYLPPKSFPVNGFTDEILLGLGNTIADYLLQVDSYPRRNYTQSDMLYCDGLDVYRNGNRLSESDVRTLFAGTPSYHLYDTALRMNAQDHVDNLESAGMCMVVLAPITQLAWLWYGLSDFSWGKDVAIYGGVATLGSGLICYATAAILKNSPRKKISRAVNKYNRNVAKSYSYEYSFGPTPSGVGLCLKF